MTWWTREQPGAALSTLGGALALRAAVVVDLVAVQSAIQRTVQRGAPCHYKPLAWSATSRKSHHVMVFIHTSVISRHGRRSEVTAVIVVIHT